jgi:hypothetical protein
MMRKILEQKIDRLTWVSVVFSATTGVSSVALMSWIGATVVSVVDIVIE